MKDRLKKGICVLLAASLACMVPLPAFGEGSAEAGTQSVQAMTEDAEMSAAIQELLTSSFKAGAAVDELSKATDGAIVVDFSNLPEAPDDEAWVADAEKYLASLKAASPQSMAEDENQIDLLEAQGSAVSYAIDRAKWSVAKGRSSDLSSEAVYMYISHYIDIGSNYWSAGSIDYLLDGPARSNVQPFFSQWLLKADRDAYSTYINATSGTKYLAEIGDIAIGAAGIVGTAREVYAAAGTLGQISEWGYRSKASVAGLSVAYDGAALASDLADLQASIDTAMSNDPDRKVSEIAAEFAANKDILVEYDQMAKEEMIGIVMGMAATAMLAGGPVGVIGAGAVGLVASAASISLHMASDFYSYVAWLAMRYGWSSRYSMRLYEQLFG